MMSQVLAKKSVKRKKVLAVAALTKKRYGVSEMRQEKFLAVVKKFFIKNC